MASIWHRLLGTDDSPGDSVDRSTRPAIPEPPPVATALRPTEPSPDDANAMDDTVTTAPEPAEDDWQTCGVPEGDVPKWLEHGFLAREAAEWRAAGCQHPFLAARWRQDHFAISDARNWIAGGISDPNRTGVWTTAGWASERARPWLIAGVESPKVATLWERAGIDPVTARAWIDAGVHDAEVAFALICDNNEPHSLAEFTERLIQPSVAANWLLVRNGIDPSVWNERYAWIPTCSDAQEAERWHGLGITPLLHRHLAAAHVSLHQFDQWSRNAVVDVVELISWIADGTTAAEVDAWLHNDWLAAGVVSPLARRAWISHGFESASAVAPWHDLGIEGGVAQRWAEGGFSATHAADWITCSIEDPETATHWESEGFGSTEAAAWLRAGVPDPLIAAQWVAVSVDADAVRQWRERSFAPETAGEWIAAGIDTAEAALAWRVCQVSPVIAATLINEGIDPAGLEDWLSCGIAVLDVPRWHSSHSPSDAGEWVKAGVSNPAAAQFFTQHGLTPLNVRTLSDTGLELKHLIHWLHDGWDAANLDIMVRELSSAGFTQLWKTSTIPPQAWWYWIPLFGRERALAQRWDELGVTKETLLDLQRRGVPAASVQRWVRRGAMPNHVRAAHSEGREYGEPTVTASTSGLSTPRPQLSGIEVTPLGETKGPQALPAEKPTQEWLQAGKQWMTWVKIRPSKEHPFLQAVYDEGLAWAHPEERLFPNPATDGWLDEFLATAEQLMPDLRRTPQWPAIFRSDACTIVLAGDGQWVHGWVGRGGRGVLVRFRPSDLEIQYPDDDDARFAIGAAICWYVDLAYTLPRTPAHPHYARAQGTPTSVRRPLSNTFVPQPQFNIDVNSLAREIRQRPRAHRVHGHIRTLPPGFAPSPEARAQAPVYIRRLMGPRDTFVRAHVRGGHTGNVQYLRHLSRFSMLADCLGSLGLL